MSDPLDKLARLEALEKAATPRPWLRDQYPYPEMQVIAHGNEVVTYHHRHERQVNAHVVPNHELICAQRSAVPVLAAFLREMLEEHERCTTHDGHDHEMAPHCVSHCYSGSPSSWPCPIRQAAERALEGLP